MNRTQRHASYGLFPTEADIAHRLNQDAAEWRSLAVILEREGLPPIDPLMGGRYWPAVLAFWNRRYGLSSIAPSYPDGEEDFDAL